MTRHTHDDVISAFTAGKPGVEGENLKTVQTEKGYTALIGYGNAVYAVNYGAKAHIHTEWRDYSKTTSKHFNNLIWAILEDSVLDMTGISRAPEVEDFKGDSDDE